MFVIPLSTSFINTLTPKPAVNSHETSILMGRISARYCSERGEKANNTATHLCRRDHAHRQRREKAVGRVVIKGTLNGEMRDGRPAITPPVVRRKGGTGRKNPFHR
ncbi:hypothetical protein AVEN_164064-1 [Araneus ventricosus]|uniref:Uncharacterized protein n=1 Tax=Araneus ventricosus TaxID=182803 RepID=A0A4Y2FXJ4_ARAVE|nr:hypothetical protein AVEN_164064-1 [Araneus ventricosus]